MSSLRYQLRQFFGLQPQTEEHQKQLSLEETENTLWWVPGSWGNQRDRLAYDREQVLADCMDAWRFNPLARRITD
jgi:hypothetical protein